jgi:hypothetical protein
VKREQKRVVNDVCHVNGTIGSIVAEGEIDDIVVDCLVDNGTTVSLGPKSLVQSQVLPVRDAGEISGVDGQPLEVEGKVALKIQLGKWVAVHEFLVVPTQMNGPILGADFLLKHGMVVDLLRKQLQWGEGTVQLATPAADQRRFIALADDVKISHDEVAIVPGWVVDAEENQSLELTPG